MLSVLPVRGQLALDVSTEILSFRTAPKPISPTAAFVLPRRAGVDDIRLFVIDIRFKISFGLDDFGGGFGEDAAVLRMLLLRLGFDGLALLPLLLLLFFLLLSFPIGGSPGVDFFIENVDKKVKCGLSTAKTKKFPRNLQFDEFLYTLLRVRVHARLCVNVPPPSILQYRLCPLQHNSHTISVLHPIDPYIL